MWPDYSKAIEYNSLNIEGLIILIVFLIAVYAFVGIINNKPPYSSLRDVEKLRGDNEDGRERL